MAKKDYKGKKDHVSILPLNGQIHAHKGKDGIDPDTFRNLIEDCLKNRAETIILDINSPGGSPVGSSMIHKHILALREKGIKVIAHCRDVCASGGYMIVSACDEIYAYKSSLIGSIGVIMRGFGLDEFLTKNNVEYREITAGDHKSFFNPFKPFEEKDRAYLEDIIKDVHADFIDHVYSARKNETMQAKKDEIVRAKVFNGSQAMEHGLIDGFKTVREIVISIYGDDKTAKIHRPKVKENMLKKFLSFGVPVRIQLDDLKQKLSL